MSLILDALRKSEAERRRGQLPAIALELPPVPARRLPSRAWWLLLPLAAAIAAGAYFIRLQGGDAPGRDGAHAEGPGQFVRPEPETGPAHGAVDVVPAPVDVVAPRPVVPSATVARPAPSDPLPPPPAASVSGAPATPPAAPAAASPVLAPADLSTAERQALPPLKLSMHMWSPDPARRFAIIDGQRVAEGDRIGNAVVERIEPDGVILAADGRRIRLPLP